MPSPVWFSSFRTRSAEDNKINRLKRIMKNMDMARILKEGDLTAIKLHFGERGNDGYLNLIFARQVVDAVRNAKGKPTSAKPSSAALPVSPEVAVSMHIFSH